ncbi:MAG: HAD-IB family hydrolase [Thermoflexales bacterium]|nr:HAD-IB family hydrolase [Thermoflexales bacterium]
MRIAFFDMDKTLLDVSSGIQFVKYLWRRRALTVGELASVVIISAQYSLNLMNFPKAMARLSSSIKGGSASNLKTLCDKWFEDELAPHIAPKAVARVREHEKAGEYAVLLSASTQFAVRPVAEHVDMPYCCTELAVERGALTGAVVGEPCFGAGKLYWAQRIAGERGASLKDCTFYTDSASDLPLMHAVGQPVAINPDRKLRAVARQRGWKIESFY